MFRAFVTPDQNADNLHKRYQSQTGCCPPADLTECKYRFTIPNASTITGITFTDASGVSVAKTLASNLGVTADGAKAVVRGLKALIESGGFEHDGDQIVPAYRITASGSDTIVDFFGEAVIASIQRTSGGDLTPTVTCNRVGLCTFFYAWPGSDATSTFTVNGVDATLAALTLAGNTAANVVSALEGAANWPTTADVTVAETGTAFEITITDVATNRYSLDGVNFQRDDCQADFI